jgi:hypothetical protein
MALFPMSGVLRGFPSAAYHLYASMKTPARQRERSGEAGGLVRLPLKSSGISQILF